MDEKLLIGLVSAVIGAVGTYLAAVLKFRQDLKFKYDTDLRDQRIQQYLELWKSLEALAKYARPKAMTLGDVQDLSVSLRKWYFEKGGLFLSDASRDAYFALQDVLTETITRNKRPAKTAVSGELYETLRQAGSTLRTALTRDVGTRKAPQLN